MELDSFLASPRWEILKIISERPSSPIEIAEKTKTTVSFISQQLKLLEATQLVSKEKTGAFEKGKPRNLFSISKDFFYLTILTNGFSEKKLFNLIDYQKAILKIWSLEKNPLQSILEELIIKIKKNLPEIYAIGLDQSKSSNLIIIFLEDKKIQQNIDNFFKKSEEKINFEFLSLSDLNKVNLNLFSLIHQNHTFLRKIIELKGGKKDNEKNN